MDETAVFFDMPHRYTITMKWTKHVKQRPSYAAMMALSCLQPWCSSKNTGVPSKLESMPSARKKLAWHRFNVRMDLMRYWCSLLLAFAVTLFLWIQITCSLGELEQIDCNDSIIPPRTTGECQPLDVGISKQLKVETKVERFDWARPLWPPEGITNRHPQNFY